MKLNLYITCLVCEVSEDLENIVPYKSNSGSIQKGASLAFKLNLKKSLTIVKSSRIEWTVINRGKEASDGESTLVFSMDKYKDKYVCEQSTKFNGHHYMACKFYDSQGKLIRQDKFGIYVNDEKNIMKDLGIYEELELSSK
ncbi:hypothetical protein COI88_27885 [Bacillus cereus]|nr:hypothetical protein COI88_27885 [Bacillus cereus]